MYLKQVAMQKYKSYKFLTMMWDPDPEYVKASEGSGSKRRKLLKIPVLNMCYTNHDFIKILSNTKIIFF